MIRSPEVIAALRTLRRGPGFASLAAATLGLGLGATAAMFTLLDQVVLTPLPVERQADLVVAWGQHRTRDLDHFPYTFQAWDLIREGDSGLAGVAGTDGWAPSERLVEDADGLTPVRWSRVLGDFFGVLGVEPILGRALAETDDVAGGARVAVVSWGLWMRRWGGDPGVLGSTLTVDGQPHAVVGVMPRDLDYPRGTEVWTPLRPQYAVWSSPPPLLELDLVARMLPGATRTSVAPALDRLLQLDPDLARMYSDVTPIVRPFADVMLGDLRPVIIVLFAGAVLLLLVAGANVASLTAVRAAERAPGLAIRRALGARRGDLAAGAAAEAAIVAGLGGAVAVGVAIAGLGVVLPLAPGGIRRLDTVRPDVTTWSVLALLLVLCFALILGVTVARSSRAALVHSTLRGGARTTSRQQASRAILIAAQAGLGLWTVAAASLLFRTMNNLVSLDTGFDQAGLHVVHIDHRYTNFQLPPGLPTQLQTATDRIRAVPGVTAATTVLSPPLVGSGFDIVPRLIGADHDPDATLPYLSLDLVSPGYFETLGLPIVRGRLLDGTDRPGAEPSVVVNEAAAMALWPGQEPLGKRLILAFPSYEEVEWAVVGIAADSRYRELIDVRPAIYAPLSQMPVIPPRWLAIRTTAPLDLVTTVASVFSGLDPSVRVVGAEAVPDRMAAPLARPRFALAVLGVIATLVLVLAAVGVYGVMAASVRSRTREMGVRMACGARPADVGALVLREAILLAAIGAAGGLLASWATGRFIESLLFGVAPGDPIALAAASFVVLATTAAACLAPALRAAGTDPMTVLKAQ